MKKIILSTFLLIASLPFAAKANTDHNLKNAPEGSSACRQIAWHETKPIIIYTALYRHVHITLPDDLIMEPINPNALFDVVGQGKHLFISPTSEDKLAQTTTVSALTKDGSSYDFVVHQNVKKHVSCVNITNRSFISKTQLNALKSPAFSSNGLDVGNLQQKVTKLKRRLRAQETKAKADKLRAVKEAIRKYRYHIYTRYNWNSKKHSNSFLNTNLINDIYDDGRFTYLRLASDNKGIPSIQAVVAGKPALIESKYDEVADLYRIVGIFPSISLIYGEDKLKVTRLDKDTKGEF